MDANRSSVDPRGRPCRRSPSANRWLSTVPEGHPWSSVSPTGCSGSLQNDLNYAKEAPGVKPQRSAGGSAMSAGMQRSAGEVEARRRGRRPRHDRVLRDRRGVHLAGRGQRLPTGLGAGLSILPRAGLSKGLATLAQSHRPSAPGGEQLLRSRRRRRAGSIPQRPFSEVGPAERSPRACGKDRELASLLDVVERLRYAEERAVRREVSDLAPLRRRVGQISTNSPER